MMIDVRPRAQLPEDVAAASLAPIAVSTARSLVIPMVKLTMLALLPLLHVRSNASRHLHAVSNSAVEHVTQS